VPPLLPLHVRQEPLLLLLRVLIRHELTPLPRVLVIKLATLNADLNPLLARAVKHVEPPGAIRTHMEPSVWGCKVLQYDRCQRIWPIDMASTTNPSAPIYPTLHIPQSKFQTPPRPHLTQPRPRPMLDRKCILAQHRGSHGIYKVGYWLAADLMI
jgi:hypothetical protein